MDPLFDSMRFNRTCAEWARDTVEQRYAGLEDIRRTSQERERAVQRSATRPRNTEADSNPSCSDRPTTPSADSSTHPQRTLSTLQSRGAPGFTVLYRASDQARTVGLFDADGKIQDIQTISSLPPTDFSGIRSMYYFTPNYKGKQKLNIFTLQAILIRTIANSF